ncbi:hypothetical protein CFP56_005218 [Quercus suber]|uniref:Uncharacterized protein n=1 Tax=Quercus suber TaxID=58331 RepID=A0AAW0LA01_QUESU
MWWRFQSHHRSCVHILSGLPCIGTFYDKVVPSAKKLQKVDGYGQPYLPRNYHYLLTAYHRLQGRMKVKKTNLPKRSQNPSGVIRELQEVYGYGQPYLPHNCRYLYIAYHHLQGGILDIILQESKRRRQTFQSVVKTHLVS